jgi:hypothetical protein
MFVGELEAARTMFNEAMKYVDLTVTEVSKGRFQAHSQGVVRLGKKFGDDHTRLFPEFPRGEKRG